MKSLTLRVRKTTFVLIAATGVFILLLAQWRTHSQTPVPTCQAQNLATPLPGLTDPLRAAIFA